MRKSLLAAAIIGVIATPAFAGDDVIEGGLQRISISFDQAAKNVPSAAQIERCHALACLDEALARSDELSAQANGEKRG